LEDASGRQGPVTEREHPETQPYRFQYRWPQVPAQFEAMLETPETRRGASPLAVARSVATSSRWQRRIVDCG
jgi:hypothetical protein